MKTRENLRRSHLVTDVVHFAGALDAATAVTIRGLTQVWVVDGQRSTDGSDVIASRRVVAGRTYDRVDRDCPSVEDDHSEGGGGGH